MCNPPPPLGIQIGEERELERPSRPEDELIPFSDTPQISRFGPISRRIICPQSVPTQSQAIIGDETRPTSVVRHSKHMSRPVPVAASLLHQNGKKHILDYYKGSSTNCVAPLKVIFDPLLLAIQASI